MELEKIQGFYQAALKEGKFSQEFLEELQVISKDNQFKKFIDERVQPIAQQMGYDISTDEFLNYEKAFKEKIDEQYLENVSGGIGIKNLTLGGLVSLMAIGAAGLASGSLAHAEINTQQVSKSVNTMTQALTCQHDETMEHSPISDEHEVTDLATAQAAAEVAPDKIMQTKSLTEAQQLYALKALNMQDAYALLQSKVIENLRLFGNISEISLNAKGDRQYSADKGGDAFSEILFMLFPSPAGSLNTNFGGDKKTFSKFGGISPETMARFCAILDDYRNGAITEEQITLNKGKDFLKGYGFANDELNNAKKVNFYCQFLGNLIDSIDSEKIEDESKELERRGKKIKRIEKVIQELTSLIELKRTELLGKQNDLNSAEVRLKELEELKQTRKLTEIETVELAKLNRTIKSINQKKLENNEREKNLEQFKKRLENIRSLPYSKYLTERILMAYMVKTLNNEEEIERFYSSLAEQLAHNKSSNVVIKKSRLREIEAEKARLERLSEIISAAKFQALSPYKNKTFSNASIFAITQPNEKGEVLFKGNFSDCADTTVRHVINLLSYSNEGNWDKLLAGIDEENLRAKLEEVIYAINNQGAVNFYNLKERLQMFFLYQRDHGADNDSKVIRTLWEYAICNMEKENEGMYKIVYKKDGCELKTGYVNMLKLMYNVAHALDLGDAGELADVRKKIDNLADKKVYDETAFEEALGATFALFHPSDNLGYEPESCEYEEIDNRNEFVGEITATLERGNELVKIKISQKNGHAFVSHNPIDPPSDEKFTDENGDYMKDDFAKLLLIGFDEDVFLEKIQDIKDSLYKVLYGEELRGEDPSFTETELYKKYQALHAFKKLHETDDDDVETAEKLYEDKTFDVEINVREVKYKTIITEQQEVKYEKYETITTLQNKIASEYGFVKEESDEKQKV